MRIALGGIYQESHTFSPAPATLDQFRAGNLLYGEDIVRELSDLNHEIGGALEAALGHTLAPLLYASAGSSGQPLRRQTYDELAGGMLARLQKALPVDGVLMAMHGAMAAEHHDDATGHLLDAVREMVGPEVPVVATLDLHANVTRRMASAADALVGYHTAPHVDQRDTGRRGMTLLLSLVEGQVKARTVLRQIPMVLPSENGQTTTGPFSEVMAQVRALERRPGILAASAYSVQPWLDLPEMGCSVVVVTDGDRRLAEREAESLSRQFWQRRREFTPSLVPLQDAIDRALSGDRHPYIFSDSSDAPSSGAPGDSTVVLKALLDRNVQETVLLNIVDPPAVSDAISAGVGATRTFTVGGGFSPEFYRPVRFAAYVQAISDGVFRFKGPGFQGVEFRMGRTAVVVSGGVHLVIMEQPVIQWDPELYRCLGLEPADASIVTVKSPAAFRAAYAPIAAEILVLDVPGVCSPNLQSFPWKRISHPMFPFDESEDARAGKPTADPDRRQSNREEQDND